MCLPRQAAELQNFQDSTQDDRVATGKTGVTQGVRLQPFHQLLPAAVLQSSRGEVLLGALDAGQTHQLWALITALGNTASRAEIEI